MSRPAENLLQILELEPIERNLFRGRNEDRMGGRLFGGQVVAQALRAASCTVKERVAHSLHGYFLRPGSATRPVLYDVERIRDGSSFTTRRVVAIQQGEAICNVDISFQTEEDGLSHEAAMPNVPLPETLEDDVAYARRQADDNPHFSPWARRERPFESRSVYRAGVRRPPHERMWNPVWLRFKGKVDPNDRALGYCLLAYASDMGLVSTSVIPHMNETPRTQLQLASLDHALWIHRRFAVDDWMLFVKRTAIATGGRGMNHAEFYDRGGQLIASVSQEGLLRVTESAP
jgi:acyl-CoA thioesterase-2